MLNTHIVTTEKNQPWLLPSYGDLLLGTWKKHVPAHLWAQTPFRGTAFSSQATCEDLRKNVFGNYPNPPQFSHGKFMGTGLVWGCHIVHTCSTVALKKFFCTCFVCTFQLFWQICTCTLAWKDQVQLTLSLVPLEIWIFSCTIDPHNTPFQVIQLKLEVFCLVILQQICFYPLHSVFTQVLEVEVANVKLGVANALPPFF